MEGFKVAHIATDDWSHAAKHCADALGDGQASLGFLYVTEALSGHLGSLLTYLRQKTAIPAWIGAAGMGICAEAREYFEEPAVCVMSAALPENAFAVLPTLAQETAEIPAATRAWIKEAAPSFAIVHADPANSRVPGLLEELARETNSFLVGGLTSSRQGSVQVAGDVTGGGLSGALFAPEIEVATGLSQGCAPIGESHTISDSVDNVVIGLDGRRALDVFKEDVGGVLARDLNQTAGYIHAALPIEGSDTGDYMVRSLVGIDPDRGWLAVGGEVRTGERILFVRRDPETAEADLLTMVEKLKHRVRTRPRGALYISCIARGAAMFGEEGREMALIRDSLGNVPLVGFYAGGEISNCRLYGYTGVLTLFL